MFSQIFFGIYIFCHCFFLALLRLGLKCFYTGFITFFFLDNHVFGICNFCFVRSAIVIFKICIFQY